jgi:hypothetical protein
VFAMVQILGLVAKEIGPRMKVYPVAAPPRAECTCVATFSGRLRGRVGWESLHSGLRKQLEHPRSLPLTHCWREEHDETVSSTAE